MQQLRKYTICCILLAVQVQTVLCSRPNPRIFSSRSVYANSDNALPGASLKDAKFKVIFSEAIDETTFDKSDIDVVVETDESTTQAPTVMINTLTKISDVLWEFDLVDARDTIPDPSDAVTHVSFHMTSKQVSTSGGESSYESNSYSIKYASEFLFKPVVTSHPEGTGTIIWELETTRDSHVIGNHPLPFKVCTGDCTGTDSEHTSASALLNGEKITYKVYATNPATQYCLIPTAPANEAVVADYYGNSIDSVNLPDLCVDTPDDPCAYSWGPWSPCTYPCEPEEADKVHNIRSRTQVFYTPDKCDQLPLTESKACDIANTQKCVGFIFGGETGNECSCAENDTPEEVDLHTYRTKSGCFCGGSCVENNNCCQSYYKNCIENAEDDPKYAYSYFKEWKPQVCNTDTTRPACTSRRRGTSNFSGESNGRQYNYYCMCSVERFKCFDYSNIDQCCGGEEDYRERCDYPKEA